MATTLPLRRRALVATGTAVVAAAGLIGATAVAASADPAALNRSPCSVTLDRVLSWPGEIPTPDGLVRHFSDAFDSYLSSLPECAAPPGG
jgi:hypothetical protein